MNYLAMDRASDTAAHDLAEVRKLIEGMNALVNSQAIQQQQQQRQGQLPLSLPDTSYVPPVPSHPAQESQLAPSPGSRVQDGPLYGVPDIPAPQPPQPTALPTNGTIVEVTHLLFNRTLYFQLTPDATIEPLITWLRVSFNDHSISGMVLQYKGFDGLWKCLLNRDDSLKRILKQSLKGPSMLQMRVPREEDLLSSGYTDRRLLALTKPGS